MAHLSMQQGLAGRQLTCEQRKIYEDITNRIVALMKKDEMRWEVMEPLFIDIYRQAFTQSEVDGMLAFYRSQAGQAVLDKTPAVMQSTLQLMQDRLQQMMPKLEKLLHESMAQLEAAETQSTEATH